MTAKLVLVRHGQSEWNLKNLFTGWTDVDLTDKGVAEARQAGRDLKGAGFEFDVALTSVLTRAIRTLWFIMEEMDCTWMPVERHWRLNERHYGALQGLNKAETVAKHGAEQVKIWRRSYDVPPPPLGADDPRHPAGDPRYARIPASALPGAESLKTTLDRVRPYWVDYIAPQLLRGQNLLIAAHGNSLRALVKMLEDISDTDIVEFNIPTGIPRVYELDAHLRPLSAEFMGDPEVVAAATAAAASHGQP